MTQKQPASVWWTYGTRPAPTMPPVKPAKGSVPHESTLEAEVTIGLDSSDVDELNLKLSEALRLSLLLKKALKELGISIEKDAGKTPIEFHTDLMKGMLEIHQRDL